MTFCFCFVVKFCFVFFKKKRELCCTCKPKNEIKYHVCSIYTHTHITNLKIHKHITYKITYLYSNLPDNTSFQIILTYVYIIMFLILLVLSYKTIIVLICECFCLFFAFFFVLFFLVSCNIKLRSFLLCFEPTLCKFVKYTKKLLNKHSHFDSFDTQTHTNT